MKHINLFDINESNIQIVAEDDVSLKTLCEMQEVSSAFGGISDEELFGHVDKFDGNDLSDGLRNLVRNNVLEDGTSVGVDLEFDADYVARRNAQEQPGDGQEDAGEEDDVPVNGQPGMVTVATSGGIKEISVPIINGQTSIYSVIYSDRIRDWSLLTEQMLSNQTVVLNDEPVEPNKLKTTFLKDRDYVSLCPKAAHSKAN